MVTALEFATDFSTWPAVCADDARKEGLSDGEPTPPPPPLAAGAAAEGGEDTSETAVEG